MSLQLQVNGKTVNSNSDADTLCCGFFAMNSA